MKLQDLVTPLQPSSDLRRLGIAQSSHFCWEYDKYEGGKTRWGIRESLSKSRYLSAFTSSELSELLPVGCSTSKTKSGHTASYKAGTAKGKTEVEAKAKMLIHLIEKQNYKPKS